MKKVSEHVALLTIKIWMLLVLWGLGFAAGGIRGWYGGVDENLGINCVLGLVYMAGAVLAGGVAGGVLQEVVGMVQRKREAASTWRKETRSGRSGASGGDSMDGALLGGILGGVLGIIISFALDRVTSIDVDAAIGGGLGATVVASLGQMGDMAVRILAYDSLQINRSHTAMQYPEVKDPMAERADRGSAVESEQEAARKMSFRNAQDTNEQSDDAQ